MNSCAFTGHRPNKLGGYNYSSDKNLKIKEKAKEIIIFLIEKEKVGTFYVGGALGFDQMMFDILYNLKKKYKNIKIIVAIPFEKQDNNWPDSSKEYYRNQLTRADDLIYVDKVDKYKLKNIEEDIYHIAKMQKRNEYMVDNSDFLIACFDGTKGGTKHCVDYFKEEKDKSNIYLINPENLNNLCFETQYYKEIPLKLINRDYEGYKAKRFIINDTNQNIWIPNSCLTEDGKLKENINLNFIFNKEETLNKLRIAGIKKEDF